MEWKKVLRQKKILGIFAVLFVFQIFFFLYSMQEKMRPGVTADTEQYEREEQRQYIAGFHESVEEKVKQADSMNTISIFAQADSFSNRNLERTKEDFQALLTVKPIAFNDRFLREFFSFPALNGIVVLCGVVVAIALTDENRPGLRGMIFASVNGRGRLVLEKEAALLLWAAVITICFYGGTLAASTIFFHGNLPDCLGYPVQSLSMFANLPWKVGIGIFLLIYLLYRFFFLFLLMLLVWTILFCIDYMLLAAGVTGILGILAYLSYRLVESSSPLNFLRYGSLWYQAAGTSFFTEYKNLNIFSHAVSKNTLILVEWLVLGLLFSGAAFFVGNYRYPCTSTVGRIKQKLKYTSRRIRFAWSKWQEKLSLTGMEYYKVLFSQKGIVVIIFATVVLVYQTDFTRVQLSGKQEMYAEFLDKCMGKPGKESRQEIEDLKKLLQGVEDELQDAFLKNQNGELSDWDLTQIQRKYETYEQHRNLLELLESQTAYLENLKTERNIEGWYVNVYSYNHLLDDASTLSGLFLVMGVVLLCSGIFAGEKKSGMVQVIKGCADGRTLIYRKKIQVSFVLTFFLFLVAAALQIISVRHVYGINGLEAPVQSLPVLSFVPMKCSIGVFFSCLYLIKAGMLLSVASFTCMLSVQINQKFTIGLAFVLCVPELLVMVGFGFFKYVSVVEVFSVAPFLLQTGNVGMTTAAVLFFLVFGILSVGAGHKKWCMT